MKNKNCNKTTTTTNRNITSVKDKRQCTRRRRRLPYGGSKNKVSAVEDMPQRSRDFEPHAEAFEEISDLSPIRVQEDDDDDAAPSETSSAAVQPTSFLQRLQACSAPIMPRTTANNGEADCNAVPMAHLAFLRPSGGTSLVTLVEAWSTLLPSTKVDNDKAMVE
jgi:hypothetical protein